MLPWWYVVIVLQFWPMDAPPEIWNYDDPTLWNLTFPLCHGPLQSPIMLTEDRLVFATPPALEPALDLAQGEVEATNTGRWLELRLLPANRSAPAFQLVSYKKPLFGVYNLDHVQVHWGDAVGTKGSEHALNGKFSDAEVQFVFVNQFYGPIQRAKRHPGGLAIVSALLRGAEPAVPPAFPALGLEEHLPALAPRGGRVNFLADLTPVEHLLSGVLKNMLAYYGSFTSPPCNPVVTWLVGAKEWDVSAGLLRGLTTGLFQDSDMIRPLVNNFRPLQDRTGRLVTKLKELGGAAPTGNRV